ncbi:MAG: hypothetical protein ACSW8E_03800 [Clostridia bacterium]
MDYPIIIEGRRSGTLRESAEGLYTVFRAECPRRDGMIRLWLHGGGQSACLGLLAPCGEHLMLTRRLSRRARTAFPRTIELVSDQPRFSARAAPAPPRQAPEPEGWRALGDGTLLAADGRRAIPAALPPDSPLAPHLIRIGGRDYLVFRL